MNKRKAKKKYKQIYEEKLKRGTLLIDLDKWWSIDNVSTVYIKSDGHIAECGIRFNLFEYKPLGTEQYSDVSLTGKLIWFRR